MDHFNFNFREFFKNLFSQSPSSTVATNNNQTIADIIHSTLAQFQSIKENNTTQQPTTRSASPNPLLFPNTTTTFSPWDIFRRLDANPATPQLDIQLVSNSVCFEIESTKTVPFNNQQIQSFQIGTTQITNNNQLNQLLNAASSNNTDCDLASYSALINLLIQSSNCPSVSLCANDCHSLNDKLNQCGLYSLQCQSSNNNCIVTTIKPPHFEVAWWIIFIIVLAILLPCLICVFKMCNKHKSAKLQAADSNSSWGSKSLEAANSAKQVQQPATDSGASSMAVVIDNDPLPRTATMNALTDHSRASSIAEVVDINPLPTMAADEPVQTQEVVNMTSIHEESLPKLPILHHKSATSFNHLKYMASFSESSVDAVILPDTNNDIPTHPTITSYHEFVDIYLQLPATSAPTTITIKELQNGQYHILYTGIVSCQEEDFLNICQVDYYFEKKQVLLVELLQPQQTTPMKLQCLLSTLIMNPQPLDDKVQCKAVKNTAQLSDVQFELRLNNVNTASKLTIYDDSNVLQTVHAHNNIYTFQLSNLMVDSILTFKFAQVGTGLVAMHDLLQQHVKQVQLIGDSMVLATVEFLVVKPLKPYSLLNYLEHGLQIRTSVGIDFTMSNAIGNGTSSKLNEYEMAMKGLVDVLSSYHHHHEQGEIIAHGFGAIDSKLTNTTSSTAIRNTEQLLQAYRHTLKKIQSNGPCTMLPLLKQIGKMARQSRNEFWMHLVITDRQPLDLNECIEEMINCSNYPMQIIVMGVGKECDFEALELQFNNEFFKSNISNRQSRRPVCRFYNMNNTSNSEILASIPSALMSYTEMRNLQPTNYSNFI